MPEQTNNFIETSADEIYSRIIDSLMNYVNEALYPGDERRIFGEAVVAVIVACCNTFNDRAKQRLLRYARGWVLDALGERYDVTRLPATTAKTTFRFSVAEPMNENIIIPVGTRLTDANNIYWSTDTTAVLQAGSMYVDVPGTCAEGGSAYNGLPVGSISTLVDLIPYISSVGNITITEGGDDGEQYTEEGDNHFRERIHIAPAKFSVAGPETAYEYWAMTADADIIDVAVVSPDPCIVHIYALMRGGEIPDENTLQKIEEICSAEDVRPMTDVVTALAPEQVEYDIELTYYCTKENEADVVESIEGKDGVIDQYIEWQSAVLGRDINPDQLRKLVLCPGCATEDCENTVGADRVTIVKPELKVLGKGQVAKWSGSAKISHEVITG